MKRERSYHVATVAGSLILGMLVFDTLDHLGLTLASEWAIRIAVTALLFAIILGSNRLENRAASIEKLVLGTMNKTHRIVKLTGITTVDPEIPEAQRVQRFLQNHFAQLASYVVVERTMGIAHGGKPISDEMYTLHVVQKLPSDEGPSFLRGLRNEG